MILKTNNQLEKTNLLFRIPKLLFTLITMFLFINNTFANNNENKTSEEQQTSKTRQTSNEYYSTNQIKNNVFDIIDNNLNKNINKQLNLYKPIQISFQNTTLIQNRKIENNKGLNENLNIAVIEINKQEENNKNNKNYFDSANNNQTSSFNKLENYIVNKYKNVSKSDARNIVKTSYQYAQKRNLEHTLVLAIIEGESNFNKSIKSSANAVGLMQVIPKYHQETIKKAVNENTTTKSSSIYDIENNIASGTNIIRQYLDKYKSIPRALQAYRGQHNNTKYARKILNFQQEIKNHLIKI